MFKESNRIILIDDNTSDLEQLSKVFHDNGIGCRTDACDTLRTRCCYHYLRSHNQLDIYYEYLKGNISRDILYSRVPKEIINSVINVEISDNTIVDTFKRIKELAGKRKVDMIIGGPPCQAYSLLGRHDKKMENDPRTLLYLQYGKFLKEFKPKGFVFENVPGLLSAKKGEHFKNLQTYFDELGYNIHYRLLDASNYGVLQVRKRLIIVGWEKRNDLGYPNFKEDAVAIHHMVCIVGFHIGRVGNIAAENAFHHSPFFQIGFRAVETAVKGDILLHHKGFAANIVAVVESTCGVVDAFLHPDHIARLGRVDGILKVGVRGTPLPGRGFIRVFHEQRVLRESADNEHQGHKKGSDGSFHFYIV